MTREQMRKVLGKGVPDPMLDMLAALMVAHIDVCHSRPTVPMSVEHDEEAESLVWMTGLEMEEHRRHVPFESPDRRRWALRGGLTKVGLRVGDQEFEGEARCSDEDRFLPAVGRLIALSRAITKVSAPRCQEHSVAGPRSQVLGSSGLGKSSDSIRSFIQQFSRVAGPGTPLGDALASARAIGTHRLRAQHALDLPPGMFSGTPLFPFGSPSSLGDHNTLREAVPEHLRLRARAIRKLHEAEKLDKERVETKSKKERKRLREEARVLREQAAADARVAEAFRDKKVTEVVFDEYVHIADRNEA